MIKKYFPYLYLLLAFTILLFYTRNRYFDITYAKSLAYNWISVITIITGLFIFKKRKLKKAELIMLVFISIVLISSIINFRSYKFTVLGSEGWRIGLYAFISAMALILLTSSLKHDKSIAYLIISFFSLIVYIIGVFHSAAIDLFDLHKGIHPDVQFSYISTVGNINWFVGFLSLTVPIILYAYFNEKDLKRKIYYAAVLFFGIISIYFSGSNGVFLGFGIMATLMFPDILKKREYLSDFGLFISGFGFAGLLIKYSHFFDWKITTLEGAFRLLLNPYISLILIIIGLTVFFVFRKFELNKTVRKIIVIVFETGIIIAALIFIYSMIKSYLEYNYYWGNNRLLIWKTSIEFFKRHYSLIEKFIGYGPENLRSIYYYMSYDLNATVLVSHSEPIQVLMSFGYLGFISYIAVYTYLFVLYFKNKGNKAYFFAILAYFGQSLVNSCNPLNFGILTAILSLHLSSIENDDLIDLKNVFVNLKNLLSKK